jgi:hypothetical protein
MLRVCARGMLTCDPSGDLVEEGACAVWLPAHGDPTQQHY